MPSTSRFHGALPEHRPARCEYHECGSTDIRRCRALHCDHTRCAKHRCDCMLVEDASEWAADALQVLRNIAGGRYSNASIDAREFIVALEDQ